MAIAYDFPYNPSESEIVASAFKRYICSSWNGTFKTSFDSDKCEFECYIFKRNVCLVECGSNESGVDVINS